VWHDGGINTNSIAVPKLFMDPDPDPTCQVITNPDPPYQVVSDPDPFGIFVVKILKDFRSFVRLVKMSTIKLVVVNN